MSAFANHCILLGERCLAVVIEPDGYELEDHAFHARALAAAQGQVVRVARELLEADQSGEDQMTQQKMHGLLVAAEALGSLVEALASNINEQARQARITPKAVNS